MAVTPSRRVRGGLSEAVGLAVLLGLSSVFVGAVNLEGGIDGEFANSV